MAQRSLFDTVTQRKLPRETPSLFEGVTVGGDAFTSANPGSYGSTGLGDSKHDWGIKADEIYTLADRRAARQTVGEQFGAFLNQAIVGEIAGGTIEGIGYLLDLDSYGKLLSGTETEFGNWFSDIGKGLRTGAEERTPIYTDPDQNKFAPGHFSWWMKNGKSVASTLSLMVPSGLAIRGISAATKLFGVGNKLRETATVLRLAGKVKEADKLLSSLKTFNWASKGLRQAAISRHMENMMEASGVQQEMYKQGIDKGMSPADAEQYAARAASKTYSLDWAMYLQDVPQYLLLNRAFGKTTGKLADNSIKATIAMGHKLAPVIGSKAAAIGWDMLGEGFEEGYQFIAAEEAKYLTQKLEDPDSTSSFDDRLNKYVKDGEFWTNVAMGALGAGVMQTAGKAINDVIQGGDAQAKFVKDFHTKVSHAAMQVRAADIMGTESAKRSALVNFENGLFTEGAVVKGFDYIKEQIERTADLTEEDLKLFNITPEDAEFIKENKSEILDDAKDFQTLWEANAQKYEGNKAAKVTQAQFLLNKYNRASKEYENKLVSLEGDITNFHKLSQASQDIFHASADIVSQKKQIDFQTKRIENTKYPLNIEQKTEAQKLIKASEKKITTLEKVIADNEPNVPEEDKDINIGGPHNLIGATEKDISSHSIVEAMKIRDASVFTDATIHMYQAHLDDLLKDKKQPKPKKPEVDESVIKEDDYVTYVKDGVTTTGIVDIVNDDNTYNIIPTTKWADDSVLATKPTGDPIKVTKDNVTLINRNNIDDDFNVEPVGDEDTKYDVEEYEDPVFDIYLSASYFDPITGKVTNEELHQFLINSKGDLKDVGAEFFIDTTSDKGKAWFDKNGIKQAEVDYMSSGRATKAYVKDFLLKYDLVGDIPIGVRLVKDGKTILANNRDVYYHTTSFNKKYVPNSIKKGGVDAINKYKAEQRDRTHRSRERILPTLLFGDKVISNNITISGGRFNNTPGTRGKVTDRLGIKLGDVIMAVSRTKDRAWINAHDIVEDLHGGTPGTPYVKAKSTINGDEKWVKCNPTKLTEEHADMLWTALNTRYRKGALAKFPEGKYKSDLNVGEVIQMLTLFGERKTNPDHKQHPTHEAYLKPKQLYVHSGRYLFFGENNRIDLFEDNIDKDKKNKADFIAWAEANKNYSTPIELSKMGIGLNTTIGREFEIGSWKNTDKGLTLAQFLVSVPVDGKEKMAIVSDLSKDQPYVSPTLILGDSSEDFKTVVNPDKKRAMPPPKDTKISKVNKKIVSATNKEVELKSTQLFTSLADGSIIYLDYPATKQIVNGIETETLPAHRTVITKIEFYPNIGYGFYAAPTEWITIRDVDGNTSEEDGQKVDEYLGRQKGKADRLGAKIIVGASGTVADDIVKIEPVVLPAPTIESLNNLAINYGFINTDRGADVIDRILNATKEEIVELKIPQKEWDQLRTDAFNIRNKITPKAEPTVAPPSIKETLNDILGGIAMEVGPSYGTHSPVDLPKELAWFYDKFGKQNVKESDKLLRIASDGRLAFSVFTSDCIYIFTGAPEGATYHEAFHRVFLGYLSEDERQSIYASARKQFGNLTDRELSEKMAEDFRLYRLTGSKPKSRTIAQFFTDLFNFIYTFFTGNTRINHSDINRLYASINRGQFRYSKVTEDNRKRLEGIETPMAVDIHRQTIHTIQNHHELEKIVKFLGGILLETNHVDNINDVKNMKMSLVFDHIKNQLDKLNTSIDYTERQLEAGKIDKDALEETTKFLGISKNLRGIFQTILDPQYIRLFEEKIANQARKWNIKYKMDEDSMLQDIADNNYTKIFDKAAFEINSKDNMLASVKFVIATLHKSDVLDPIIGIKEYVEFNEMWNSLMYNLYSVSSVEDMMLRIESLAGTHYPYQELLDRIKKDSGKNGYLKQQVFTSVKKHRHNFIAALASLDAKGKVKEIEIVDADVKRASSLLINSWNLFFYTRYTSNPEGKKISLNGDKTTKVYNDYIDLSTKVEGKKKNKTLARDRQEIISEFTNLFNRIGIIDVDEETVNALIDNRKGEDDADRIFQTICNDYSSIFTKISKVTSDNMRKVFSDEKYSRILADTYVNFHPELISDIVLGPENNQYFVYSDNSHVTDQVLKFKTDLTYLKDHLGKVYNEGSVLGAQILDSQTVRDDLKVLTFSMFNKRGGTGSGYFDINPIEDYIFKLVAINKGLVVFPTLADKKTYYMLRGLSNFKFDYIHNDDNTLSLPEEAINLLFNYAKVEKRRIDAALDFRAEYKDAEKSGNQGRINKLFAKAVEGYHYLIRDGKPMFELGSAYKFHHFQSFNARVAEQGKDFVMDESIRQEIRHSLNENIREELVYAVELGMIGVSDQRVDGKKAYYNILLPKNIMAAEAVKHGTDSNAIKNIFASTFINTLISSIESEKLFSGDPAFYSVSKVTGEVFQDKVKRLSVLGSTGANFSNTSKEHGLSESTFNVSTFETQKFPSVDISDIVKFHTDNNIDTLKSLYPEWSDEKISKTAKEMAEETTKPYSNMDPTDGQAWISPAMYRSLAIRLGEWSDEKDPAFELLQLDRELTKEETKIAAKFTFQPLKLVYFSLVHDGNLAIPTYYKASFATIFRAMGRGGKYGNRQILDVLDRMEKKGKYADLKIPKIDMFVMDMPSSSTKVGGRAKSKLFDDKIEQINDLSNIEYYPMPIDGLRRQLVTDTHDSDRTKTGTQFLKMALSNLFLDTAGYEINGESKTGREVAQVAFDCLSSLSNKGRADIEKRLGYSNGKIDKSKLVEMLQEDAKKSNATENLIDAIMMSGDDLYLELDSLTDRKWIQSRIISLINKYTIDVELPGNQLIQFSNAGIRSVNKEYDYEKVVREKDEHTTWVKHGTDDLNFMTLENGKTVPMGCIVSINLFKHIIPHYEDLTHEERLEYLTSNPEILGYRIPTQGQSSIFMLKVVGIYPEYIGDTITLPSEFTALTGSDFDIDKAYVVRYNYRVKEDIKKAKKFRRQSDIIEKIEFLEGDTNDDKFLEKAYKARYGNTIAGWKSFVEGKEVGDEFTDADILALKRIKEIVDDVTVDEYIDKLILLRNYSEVTVDKINKVLNYNSEVGKFISENKGKSLYEVNGRKAVENRLIDTYFAVMRSKLHFNGTSAPVGGLKKKLTDMAEDVRSAEETSKLDMYYLSPRFNEQVKHDYTGGKNGVGPFALNNVHHVFAQIAGLKMKGKMGDIMHVDGEGNTDLSKMFGKDNVLISNWISALLDAHVDIAKDPYIMDLNVNTFTYNVVALLIRGGRGLDTFAFTSQPILRELAKEELLSDKNNNTIVKGFSIDDKPIYKAQTYISKKWSNLLSEEDLADVEKMPINDVFSDNLAKDMKQSIAHREKEFVKRQLVILKAFTELKVRGDKLNSLIQASQIDTKKFGTNITELKVFINKIAKVYKENAFINLDKILPYGIVDGKPLDVPGANFLGTYASNSIRLSMDILGNFSMYGTPVFESLFDHLCLITGNQYNTNSKFIGDLSDEMFTSIVSKFFTDPTLVGMTPNKLSNLLIQVPYTLGTIKTNEDGKYDDLKDNAFLKYLFPVPLEDTVFPVKYGDNEINQYIAVPMKSIKDVEDRDSMIASFNDLLADPRKEVSELARRLFLYSFYTTGLRSRINSFAGFVPNELYKSIDILDPTDKTKTIPISYNDKVIRNVLAKMRDISNLIGYTDIIDDVIINNHADNNIVKLIEAQGIAEYIDTYKGKKYDKTIAVTLTPELAKSLSIGKDSKGNQLLRPYIKIYDEQLGHLLMKFIGYVSSADASRPLYVAVPMRSYISRGVVIKENGMPKSIIPIYNEVGVVTPAMEEEFMIRTANGERYRYIPRGEQLVLTEESTEVEEPEVDVVNEKREQSVANIPQNLVSGVESFGTKQEANSEAKRLLGNSPHSIDMIEVGLRTRTTRSVGEMQKYNIKVGDIVTHFGKSSDGTTKQILTKITAIHPKGTPEFLGTWEKEGWTKEGISAIERFKDGAAAIEFEILNKKDVELIKEGGKENVQEERREEGQRREKIIIPSHISVDEKTAIEMKNEVLSKLPKIISVEPVSNELAEISEEDKKQYESESGKQGVNRFGEKYNYKFTFENGMFVSLRVNSGLSSNPEFTKYMADNKISDIKLTIGLQQYLIEKYNGQEGQIDPTDEEWEKAPLFREAGEVTNLSDKLLSFLNKLNVTVEFRDDLKELSGYDAESLTDLLYKTILIKNNYKDKGLLKETAYVAYSFLGKKNKIRTDLIHSIDSIDNYSEIFNDYKERSPQLSDGKIKELIVVDFIADAIKNNFNVPKDSYQNRKADYWKIQGNSKLERQIKYYLLQIKLFLEKLFINTKLSAKELESLVDDIANDILVNNFNKYGKELSAEQQLTNYEDTIGRDTEANDIINSFQNLGLLLTGSLSLRRQGNIYRSVTEDLHDLDFTVSKENHGEFFNKLLLELNKELKDASEIGKTFLLEKFRKELNNKYREHPIFSKIKELYPSFEITSSFTGSMDKNLTVTGKIGNYIIDIFFVNQENLDSQEKGFQDWQPIFKAKLLMGRAKDLRDFINYLPYNVNIKSIAKEKGFRHFTFKSIKNDLFSFRREIDETKQEFIARMNSRIKDGMYEQKDHSFVPITSSYNPETWWVENQEALVIFDKKNKGKRTETLFTFDKVNDRLLELVNQYGKEGYAFKREQVVFPVKGTSKSRNKNFAPDNVKIYKINVIKSLGRDSGSDLVEDIQVTEDRVRAAVEQTRQEVESTFDNIKDKTTKEVIDTVASGELPIEIKRVLDLIATKLENNPTLRVIVDESDKTKFAEYDPETNTITLNKQPHLNRAFENIGISLSHELLHAFGIRAIRNRYSDAEKQFASTMDRLYKIAKKQTKFKNDPAYASLEEWVSYVLTEPKIMREAMKMKLNLWQRFVKGFKQLIGVTNVYDEAFAATVEYLGSSDVFTPLTKGRKLKRSITEDFYLRDNDTHKEIWNTLDKLHHMFSFDKTTHTYTLIKDSDGNDLKPENQIVFSSATQVMKRWKYLPNYAMDKPSREALIGSAIHELAEADLKNIATKIIESNGMAIHQFAIDDVAKILKQIKAKHPNGTLLSEVIVADLGRNLAGSIDIVVIDENNQIHIYDFKTKINGFAGYLDKTGSAKISDYDRNCIQLSLYKDMFEKVTNLNVASLNIVTIKPQVEGNEIVGVKLDTTHSETGIVNGKYNLTTKTIYRFQEADNISPAALRNKIFYDEKVDEEERNTADDLLEQRLHVFETTKEIISSREEVVSKTVQSILVKRKILLRTGKSGDIVAINKLLDQLIAEEDVEKQLSILVKYAYHTADRIYKEYSDYKKEGKLIPLPILLSWKESVLAFDAITSDKAGLQNILTKDFDIKGGPDYRKMLGETAQLSNSIISLYQDAAYDQLVDFLTPYYHGVYAEVREAKGREYRLKRFRGEISKDISESDYVEKIIDETEQDIVSRTKTLLLTEIKKASRDIGVMTRWIDNLLDTKDPVTAAMIKALVFADENTRLESLAKRNEVVEVVRKVENWYKEKTGRIPKSSEEFYSFMLEVIKNEKTGEYEKTGYIVSEAISTMALEYKRIKQLAKSMSSYASESALINAWLDGDANEAGNHPLNRVAFETAYWEFITEQHSLGNLSDYEVTMLEQNNIYRNRATIKELVDLGSLRFESGDILNTWVRENMNEYRTLPDKWKNDAQWPGLNKILDDPTDARGDLYRLITRMSQEAASYLPFGFRLNNRLPGVVKQNHERVTSGQSIVDTLKGALSRELTFKVDDTTRIHEEIVGESGRAKYFLPVHFTGRVTKKIERVNSEGEKYTVEEFDSEEQSYDLAGIYYKYWQMANDYNNKAQILPEMELAKFVIDTRDTIRRDSFGKAILKMTGLKPKGNVPEDKLNRLAQTTSTSNLAQQVDDWFMACVYGLEEQEQKIGKVDVGKLLNFINKYTSLNLLGLNVVAGSANIILGETLQRIESFAGEYMSVKDFMYADKFYLRTMGGMIGDIGARDTQGLGTHIVEYFGVFDEHGEVDVDRHTKVGQLFRTDTLYVTSHIGEHYMQTRFLFGLLANKEMIGLDGKPIGRLIDQYIVKNNRLQLKQESTMSKAQYEQFLKVNKWTEVDQKEFKMKVRGILSRIHGEYSELGRVAIQRYALGRMAYLFRHFVVPGFRRRWGKRGYIERLNQFVEGNYITTGKFLGTLGGKVFGKTKENTKEQFFGRLISNLQSLKLSMFSEEWVKLSVHEKANVQRTLYEVAFLIAAIVLANVLASIKPEPDDDEEWKMRYWAFAAYQVFRLQNELLFFSPKLDSASSILRSPAASMSFVENIIKLSGQIFHPTEVYESGPWKGRPKIIRTINDMAPITRQIYRLRDIQTQVPWMQKSGLGGETKKEEVDPFLAVQIDVPK